jgi:hypothetical protein
MVAFHKEFRVASTITGKSMFRNKIPETHGLQFNISGIIGPALGGLLIPLAGANFVFALNAAGF